VLRFRDTLTRLRDAERELRDLNAELEQRISDRTAELNRTMQQARDSQAKLQAIVDTALDAVVRMDLDGRIVGWNRQAEMIFGWSREEALGLELDKTIIPPRFRYDHKRGMQRYLAGGGGGVLDTRIEVYALRRSGEEFPIELAITRVQAEGATASSSAPSSATSASGASASKSWSTPTRWRRRRISPSPNSWPI
jgi:PAS domain S-box-containing protein